MTGSLKKAFVIGWPIKHSRSPLIHNYWIEKYGISGHYVKIAVSPEELFSFLKTFDKLGFVGGNITVPHKEQTFKSIENSDEIASRIGASNTVWTNGGKMYSANTDGYGFLANLDHQQSGWDDINNVALVLGAGGASRAIIDALLQRKFETIYIANRTIQRADDLVKLFGHRCKAIDINKISGILAQTNFLVNTTSLGMSGQPELNISLDALPRESVVTDIVYAPLKTQLLLQAERRGNRIIDGLGMLLHQAVPGFEKWFGVRPEVTRELRNIILHDMGIEESQC